MPVTNYENVVLKLARNNAVLKTQQKYGCELKKYKYFGKGRFKKEGTSLLNSVLANPDEGRNQPKH